MSTTDDSITMYLAENPRMTGVLFTILLVVTQAGNAAATVGGTTGGP